MTVHRGLSGELTDMARIDSGAVPRRPHHISSIAHLFLEERPTAGARDSVPDICQCAVAAPGGAAISAFAAAGLALGSPGPATLAEDGRIRWSAGTYMPRGNGNPRVLADEGGGDRNTWTVAPETGGPEALVSQGAFPAEETREIHWNHLGCVGRMEMSHLESLAAAKSSGMLPVTCSGGLVWCLQEDEAVRLGPNYFLGRLAEVIKPCRIEIMLFPNAWSSAGQPGWLEEIRSVSALLYDSGNLAPIVELAQKSCAGIPVGIHQVIGPDNLAANFPGGEGADSLWRRVAVAMMAGLGK